MLHISLNMYHSMTVSTLVYHYHPIHLDCQQAAGLSVWAPFHESASAVTQLYTGNY